MFPKVVTEIILFLIEKDKQNIELTTCMVENSAMRICLRIELD